jgi:predicted nucleotidyltransferase component of viral defense system
MSLLDHLVNEALRSRAELTSLRPVVEKELLHHDILRAMSEAGLFIGGTCLRACYGFSGLNEDLDFTGGSHFKKSDLPELARVLVDRLQTFRVSFGSVQLCASNLAMIVFFRFAPS